MFYVGIVVFVISLILLARNLSSELFLQCWVEALLGWLSICGIIMGIVITFTGLSIFDSDIPVDKLLGSEIVKADVDNETIYVEKDNAVTKIDKVETEYRTDIDHVVIEVHKRTNSFEYSTITLLIPFDDTENTEYEIIEK